MTKFFFLVSILFFSAAMQAQKQSIDMQVNEIVSKLTLDDKINLISGAYGMISPGIEQLGIPALKMTDGPYGPHWIKAPAFPAGVCLAATWDTTIVNTAAVAMGQFTLAQGRNTLLGPCVNIHRVVNGGRNFESYSEDPWLASRIAVAVVKGLQSQHVVPTVKHFALNNNDWNRHLTDVRVSDRALREIYLPAFEATVKEANAWAIMSSYNLIDGIHASENNKLLNKILKGEWGFKGVVVSDWASVYSTVGPIANGLDIEMPFPDFLGRDSIVKYLKTGQITEQMLTNMAKRNVYVRLVSGIADTSAKAPDKSILQSTESNNLIRTLAENGITLLKNNQNILPLNAQTVKSIAVIGPNAAAWVSGGGSSYIEPFYNVSVLQGIKNKVNTSAQVTYQVGDTFVYNEITAIAPNFLITPDGKSQGLMAEYFNNNKLQGSATYTQTVKNIDFIFEDLPPAPGIARKGYSLRFSGKIVPQQTGWYILKLKTNSPGIMYINNQPVIDRLGRMDVTPIMMRYYFEIGKTYNVRVEMFAKNGSEKCILGWIPPVQNTIDQTKIEKAVQAAKQAQYAVVCVGWEKMSETEGYDKEEGITLPANQEELINSVAAVNPNTIVVLNSGTPCWTKNWLPNVKAVVMAYYPGHEGGNAIANIIFGNVNPSGKLPFTFIADSTQNPAFKNYMNIVPVVNYAEGIYVGYRFTDKNNMKPVFPFGFGLSYTNFEISNAKIKQLEGKNFDVEVTVKNTGKVSGQEVVQLYISQKNANVDKPIKELKAFVKVSLNSGENKLVKLKLNERSFAYFNEIKNNWEILKGKYVILIGNSSENVQQTLEVEL